MNSIPQQDVANGNGQMEFLRASPTTLSNIVAKRPGEEYPSGGSTFMYSGAFILVDELTS
jgi:hypothetical protein